jgi:two-component system sensor histidine kinase HydH
VAGDLLEDGSEMSAGPPITSAQWLARVGVVVAVAASAVVLAALCGVGAWHVVALAIVALAFAIAYLVTPSPGQQVYGGSAFRPIYAMRACSVVAVAATGGAASPLLPVIAIPIAISWTMARPRVREVALDALTIAALLVLFLYATPSASFTTTELAILVVWSTVVTMWTIGRRVALLLDVQRHQAACLSRIREGALVDAESRRRGMELMTTKLAHELKNPLAAIKSLVQVEAGHASDDRSRRRLDVVMGEVDRIGKLLREYLDIARPIVDAQASRLQLDELMTDVSALVSGRAEAAGVALAVAGHGGALHADGRLLKEAIVNVVCNAIEATPRGGQVIVHYDCDDRGASIVIRDTGRGMTKDTAARVGTPFFTTRENGTGLGVVIAKTAIVQHGGTLDYQSEPGRGTIARIALPAARPAEPRDKERACA